MQEKNINSENTQELLDYSFKLLLVDVLFNNEELTKKENQDDYFDEKGYINHSE